MRRLASIGTRAAAAWTAAALTILLYTQHPGSACGAFCAIAAVVALAWTLVLADSIVTYRHQYWMRTTNWTRLMTTIGDRYPTSEHLLTLLMRADLPAALITSIHQHYLPQPQQTVGGRCSRRSERMRVLTAVAHHRNTPTTVLAALASEPAACVRSRVATHRHASTATITTLATDTDHRVRTAACTTGRLTLLRRYADSLPPPAAQHAALVITAGFPGWPDDLHTLLNRPHALLVTPG